MKVRIGNDVNLKVKLALGDDFANVLYAKAIFVNKTLKEQLKKEYLKKNRFIGRFPIEPFVNEFEPNEYNINSCGKYPKYKAVVRNVYNGFGVHPDWKNCAPIKEVNIAEYSSNISRIDYKTVIASFPAEAQLYPGEYDLIIVATVFDDGYTNNERTITANLKSVFELVENSEEIEAEDNPVRIEIVNENDEEAPSDVYIIGGTYSNNSIKLNRNDNGAINIDVSPISGWYEESLQEPVQPDLPEDPVGPDQETEVPND